MLTEIDHSAATAAFGRLLKIMDELREGCPWDKKQTIHTLRPLTTEELYELADATLNEDWHAIGEELGDLLLHIVFYARIGRENNALTAEKLIHSLCDKLVERHPHIYGNTFVKDEDEVKRNWEQIKLQKGKQSVLSGVPLSLPAVVKATRIQEKAKQVGFEWDNKEDVWLKVQEELNELRTAEKTGGQSEIEEELGDVLFSIINYARFIGCDAETALEKTNRKFKGRFEKMEKAAAESGKPLQQMSLKEMDELWNQIKSKQDTD
jgi:XTP/dITP diphosphohydrolase